MMSPVSFGLAVRPLSSSKYLNHPPLKVSGRNPYQMAKPPQLAHFNAEEQ